MPAGPAEWPTPVRSAQIGDLRFVPLQSAAALEDEGRVMRHCVADLVECCRKGCVHLYSVRNARTFDRAATLALRSENASWDVVELKADQNGCPDESVTRAAWSFLRCAEESSPAPAASDRACDECLIGL